MSASARTARMSAMGEPTRWSLGSSLLVYARLGVEV
jgi:hypothetical protein